MSKPKRTDDNKQLDKRQRKVFKLIQNNDRFGLFLGAGSGKTRIVLRHMLQVMKKKKNVNALIVTTKANVIDTWPKQLMEQMNVTGIKIPFNVEHNEYKQVVLPGKNCRYSARIMICSYENLKKLLWHYDNKYFDFLIVDESVRVKNWRAKATAIIITFSQQCKYVYPLSGLPAPNKLVDLYSQVFMLDGGDRLGANITAFRRQFLEQSSHSKFVWNVKGYPDNKAMNQTQQEVLDKIKDICVTEETETFVKKLTDVKYHTVRFDLKPKQIKQYKRFERKAVLEIDDKNFTAVSGAVLRGKLLQYVSGNIYENLDIDNPTKGPRKVERTNKQRMATLDGHLKETYKKGDKVIISYAFKHSIKDILKVASKHCNTQKIFIVNGTTSTRMLTKLWELNRVDIIITFAGSIAEGLNLQKRGGSIVFYSLTDNYNHFYQLIRRIKRRGNPKKWCHVFTLCCTNTADELVVENINGKAQLGREIMTAATLVKILKRQIARQKATKTVRKKK